MLLLFLVTTGAIVGSLLTNALIVAPMLVGATLIKGYNEYQRYDSLIAFIALLISLMPNFCWNEKRREDMNGTFGDDLLTSHHIIFDLVPALPNDLKRQYVGHLPKMSE